ncbi:phosphoribosylformylglycinamidine synthase subunit PurS [uncultured Campylobacter sp.]|mgnify:FL=1|uniref:phosphoribosylformylglycinamidine synthase subunit PurS n=1 Tax=uncultured Campylobacter sp. TaxID=218934 RepID=UPI002604F363|nr:phosphoribosylformylglycinamidine synthase subunit PurS [uncultured Campylobacter sp.]
MRVIVNVRLKQGVLDPQGKAVKHALASLGFSGVEDVRVAKQIVLDIDGEDRDKIYADVARMCDEILANTVIEDYEIVI